MKKMLVLFVLMGVMLAYNTLQAAEPIRIGLITIRSGAFKTDGDRYTRILEAGAKQINDKGGVLGRPIQLVAEDHQMKPDVAVQKLSKLVLSDKCDAIFSTSAAAAHLALAQAMPRYKKILMPVGAFSVDLTTKYFNPYVFRTDIHMAMMVKALAVYVATQKKELKKAYLLNMDYATGHDAANFYEKFIKEIAPDTEIVGRDFHPMFNKDFGPYISKIKASGADYVLTANWGTDQSQLMIQARSLGLTIPFVAVLAGDTNVLSVMPGDEAVGNLGVASYMPGVDTPEARKFEEMFHEISGGLWPEEQVWYGYKGLMMYAEAVKKAGSLDVDKVIKAFEGLKWNGPTGTVTVRAKDHQAFQPMVIGQIVKKTKYFNFPYLKPIYVISPEQVECKPEDYGWKPYEEK
jgi:branched-chain amino acid transport system substrate-binding protein